LLRRDRQGVVQDERVSGETHASVRRAIRHVYFPDTNKTSRYHTVDTMTRDEMSDRLVDEDRELTIEKDASRDLSEMLAEHMSTAGSPARVTLEPLDREESLRLYADYKEIAAYCMIDTEAHLRGSDGLHEKLGRRLSVLPVVDVSYDIVWGKAHSLVVHVKAKLAT
jgi:hypothetical protein